MPKTVNFGSPNLTKPKKKPKNTPKKKKVTTFTQNFLFLVVVGHSLIFYYFIFDIENIFTTNLK